MFHSNSIAVTRLPFLYFCFVDGEFLNYHRPLQSKSILLINISGDYFHSIHIIFILFSLFQRTVFNYFVNIYYIYHIYNAYHNYFSLIKKY